MKKAQRQSGFSPSKRHGQGGVRAASYLRTSTDTQDGAAQRLALADAASRRGWVCLELEDVGESGAKSSRPALDELRRLARAGKVSDVLVPALDRLGRSMLDVVMTLDEWASLGVTVHSLREGTLDPTTPIGRFTVQILAALAEMERAQIRERTLAGMDRARRQGTRSGLAIGRPRANTKALDYAAQAVREGVSVRHAAKAHGVPEATLRRRVRPRPRRKGGVTKAPPGRLR